MRFILGAPRARESPIVQLAKHRANDNAKADAEDYQRLQGKRRRKRANGQAQPENT